jgi:hypothetical protein
MSSAKMRYKALIPSLVNLYVANNTMERTTALRDGLLALDTGDWSITKKDADRLLTVWASKESDPAASAIVGEIDSILAEFIETSAPTLVITDRVTDRVTDAVITDEMTEPIQHVLQPGYRPQVQVQAQVQFKSVFVEPEEEVEVEVESMDVEEEVDEEEEEEEEEEEDEGMEVEKRKIRGVYYWFEAKTNKLYAIEGEDDVGDEVGAIVNGKPVMLA